MKKKKNNIFFYLNQFGVNSIKHENYEFLFLSSFNILNSFFRRSKKKKARNSMKTRFQNRGYAPYIRRLSNLCMAGIKEACQSLSYSKQSAMPEEYNYRLEKAYWGN